jgi:hypothetical protein
MMADALYPDFFRNGRRFRVRATGGAFRKDKNPDWFVLFCNGQIIDLDQYM